MSPENNNNKQLSKPEKSIFSFKRLHKVPETVDAHRKLKYEKWTDKISQSLSFMVRSLNYTGIK